MSDDFDFEPVPGLPEHLPAGERIVWQGGPRWQELARRAYHVDKIAGYFALLITLRLFIAVRAGQPVPQALASFGTYALAATLALAVIAALAYHAAQSTIYTLTTERVVMRFGIALPLTINIPLAEIAGANLARRANGTGDVAIEPIAGNRLAYLVLWPNARAWHLNNPQPTLRCIPDVEQVAQLLGEGLNASASSDAQTVVRVRVAAGPSHRPAAASVPQLTAAE